MLANTVKLENAKSKQKMVQKIQASKVCKIFILASLMLASDMNDKMKLDFVSNILPRLLNYSEYLSTLKHLKKN